MRIYSAFILLILFFGLPEKSYSHGGKEGNDTPLLSGEPTPTLYELLESQWVYLMHEFPEWATDLGYPGQNARWTDMSLAATERRQGDINDFINSLRWGNRYQFLDAKGKFDYDLVMFSLRDQVESFPFHEDLLPISQLYGIQQDIPYKLSSQPNNTVQDYNDILARMRGVPHLVNQVIALMDKGIEMHIVQPKITMRDVPDQVRSLLAGNPKNSPLLKPFTAFPASIGEHDRATLTSMALEVYRDSLAPAFEKLYQYLVKNYIPNCRESIALKDLPNGANWYKYKVHHHTTTMMSPTQIFDLGIREVKTIRARMDSIRESVGFSGDLAKFFDYLRTAPQFFYKDSASLINGYKEIAAKANASLPKLFGKLPKLNFEVVPVPAYSQKSQTTAYYNQGSLKVGRPAYFFANTYDVSSRPKWEMEPLTLHESVPGHHLQIELAQELEGVPELLKNTEFTAFVEGWGLYAERLGTELGFYKDPYNKMGELEYNMWRSIRLVVDVGMHDKGWTRQQAIDFFAENSGKSKHDIEVEIDRYIVDPGQALAYKIGALKIRQLRAYALKELSTKFDVRTFHDELLGAGAQPLEILEKRMKKWVSSLKEKKK